MRTAGSEIDYTETLRKTFGQNGWRVGMTLFIFMLTIPLILYFQLLSQLLYPVLYDIGRVFKPSIEYSDDK